MANGGVPSYLAQAKPNPASNRSPWFKNTAQSYAGIFLWIAFFDQLGGTVTGPSSLGMANLGVAVLALVCAAVLSVALFYVVPGLLGMKTGLPLYIVGTSTFGTKGGYFLPGIFMGILQIGWYSVATYYAAGLVLKGLGLGDFAVSIFGEGGQFSVVFVITAIVWGYVFAFFGAKGIKYVASVATFFPIVIILMLIVGAFSAMSGLDNYERPEAARMGFAATNLLDAERDTAIKEAESAGKSAAEAKAAGTEARSRLADQTAEPDSVQTAPIRDNQQAIIAGMGLAGFLLIIQMVIGFFATAAAVGADFCSNNRNSEDVWLGGITGIGLAIVFAGALALVTVAGARGQLAVALGNGEATWGQLENYTYGASLPTVSPALGKIMLILFAVGSMAPACFCSFIIGNSLSTMLGSEKTRVPLTLGGATIGIFLAALGVAGNLEPFFGLIGASFGPVIGAMTADYLLSGGKWPGPRAGVSIPGYAAWLLGFAAGVLNHPWIGALPRWHPTSVYSLVVGFVVYLILAKVGMEPETVDVPNLRLAETESGEPAAAEW
jgi:cytosine/uracil/thiamine/allantoin permease